MDLALTTALVILALCAPGAWAPPAPQTPTVPVGSPGVSAGSPTSADRVAVTRVSLSTALLGRRVAVASAATPVAAPEPIVQEQGSRQPETAASPQPQAISEPGSLPWGDPRRLAVCTRDGILRSVDGGQTWTAVPTDGVATLAAGSAMPLAPLVGDPPGCQSVTLDPNSPDVFYAVFEGVKPPQDAPPPWFAAGYVTRDAGQTWEPVPALSGARFGGFTTETGTVQALYAPEPSPPSTPPHREAAGGPVIPPLVQESTDGGQTWTQIPFSCPDDGPCIRWGVSPAATGLGSCAMHGYPQPLLVSSDDGQTWRQPEGAQAANACQPNELDVLSNGDVLLLAPGIDERTGDLAPVRVSHDGGATFSEQPLPTGQNSQDIFELYRLPDGRLLAWVSSPTPDLGWSWQLLVPDALSATSASADNSGSWCMVAAPETGVRLPENRAPLRVAGERIWWLNADGQPQSVAFNDLACSSTP